MSVWRVLLNLQRCSSAPLSNVSQSATCLGSLVLLSGCSPHPMKSHPIIPIWASYACRCPGPFDHLFRKQLTIASASLNESLLNPGDSHALTSPSPDLSPGARRASGRPHQSKCKGHDPFTVSEVGTLHASWHRTDRTGPCTALPQLVLCHSLLLLQPSAPALHLHAVLSTMAP